jgi:hypothetical protein
MEERTLSYGYYLVAYYLDLLGQQRKLSALKELPRTAEEMHETQQVLATTAGAVLKFRELLDGFMHQYQTPGPWLHTLPRPVQDQLLHARQSVKYHGFSDTLLMTVRLLTGDEHCTCVLCLFPFFRMRTLRVRSRSVSRRLLCIQMEGIAS